MDDQTSSRSQRKIRNFLINSKFQLKYVFWTTSTGTVLILISSSVFYTYIRENYKILVDMSPMEDEAKVQLYKELHHILFWLGGFSLVFILVVGFLGIIVSHRTAGPMYHFKKVFMAIQSGDIQARVHLRPHDEFQDVAAECNKMIDLLQGKSTQ